MYYNNGGNKSICACNFIQLANMAGNLLLYCEQVCRGIHRRKEKYEAEIKQCHFISNSWKR